jgi:hypothetical protein
MNPLKRFYTSLIIALIFAITSRTKSVKTMAIRAQANSMRGVSSMSAVSELLLLAIGGVLVAVGITIVQPALNNLTTGASPVISPTSTAGSLIPYVALFLILAYLVLIIAVVIKAFR